MDIAAWLRDLGLERYIQAFEANDVDAAVLRTLSADDLKELGVTSLGHRKKLLDAIAALSTPPPEDPVAGAGAADAGAPAARHEAERRQLTVMFCDVVGSTTLAARLDPEDMGRVIRAYQSCCAEVVERWGGHVAKYMGDGVLAYFGWPQAHEDDAERAVRAGLELTAAVSALEAPGLALGGGRDERQPLAARVGIATGLVMVGELIGEGAAKEQTVVGETPNLAARLQALAAPGSVVISQATRRLVGGLFELAQLGPRRVKGFAEPLTAWRVEGEGRAEGRFEALHGERLTPLVGREHELGILLERWAWARDGDGQVVLLSGEPGIGKSRLLRALRQELSGEPYVALSHFCSPYHTNSALHPVIAQLERAAGFAPDDEPAARLTKLETLLGQATDQLDEAVPLVGALLGLFADAHYPPLNLSPQRQKQRTLEVLIEQLAGLARDRPVLELYEDVHWIDPSTLELLDLLIERVRALRILAVLTYRPEFQPPWTGQAHVTALPLNRLGRRQGAAMVARVTGKPLPDDVAAQIVAKTDGVPLFVEELTKTVLESGLLQDAGDRYELAGPLPPLAIPATLHDSLLARLDRLAPVKEIAQIGAALGREFSHELLAAVADRPEAELQAALDQLVAAELVYRRGTPPDVTYSFKHALVQDAAYGTLLKSKRQQLHARIAEVLEERFPEQVEAEPELLAHHCTQAGLAEMAVSYWCRAGEQALARSAMAEAAAQLQKGLELVKGLPDDADPRGRELELQIALGRAMLGAKGWAAPETGEAYSRARELCERLGETKQLFPVLWGLTVFHINRGESGAGRKVAEEMLRLAERQRDDALRIASHRALSAALYHLGEFSATRTHLERVLSLYDSLPSRPTPSLYTVDHRAMALSFLATTLFLLGYPDQAEARHREAVDYARTLGHSHSLGLVLSHSCEFHCFAHNWESLRTQAHALVSLSTEQGFPYYLAVGTLYCGSALAELGELRDGLTAYDRGFAARRATGARSRVPLFLGLRARTHQKAGRPQDALCSLVQALDWVEGTGEHLYEAELHRLKGEVLSSPPECDRLEAEACFQRAIEVARKQGAKVWELRAATSLARLWAKRGERRKGRDLLAPVYGWFTEGFDTRDLQDAKALLDEMG